ncbi:MAG TPA: lipid asymmetry maintenance ABC transporter permease subunit MlaE [Gammaproteobacteria bacterium]|jgi:phospholipid/cholesterol/gamma-HCH transport system permease protein|nr:lipid asymmetry maintenance ABC transporter permease subunit MlaE [Gammaproteobacteria bacterium]
MKFLREPYYILLDFLEMLGASGLFLLHLLRYTPHALRRPGLIFQQVFTIGAMSLVLIMVSGLFVGMVLGLQGFNTLNKFASTSMVGTLVALGLLRELGPVITALLFAGRAGTALTSEIGLMRATEQLAGMEMMAVDPVRRIVVPRFLGGVISMPLLVGIFNAVGLLGGYLVGVVLMHIDKGSFWSQIHAHVDFKEDFRSGIIKSLVFGAVATLIAVFEGYYAQPTAEGVSRATTRTVVNTALAVLAVDYLLTAFMY